MVPPLQMSCGGDFFAMIGRVIRAMIGGLFLGFFIDGIFVSIFAARGTDLLQSVRQVTAIPQLLSASGQLGLLRLG